MTLPALLRKPGPAVQTTRVRVRGGFEPQVLHARAGEPLRILFWREETAPCSERVVFPAFGKSAMLPPFEDVALELLPEHPGEYEFTCQLGMLRGRLVVDGGVGSKLPPTSDAVLVALATWLCTFPLLLLVSVPLFGWLASGTLALLWLGVVAAACFAFCASRLVAPSQDRQTPFTPPS